MKTLLKFSLSIGFLFSGSAWAGKCDGYLSPAEYISYGCDNQRSPAPQQAPVHRTIPAEAREARVKPSPEKGSCSSITINCPAPLVWSRVSCTCENPAYSNPENTRQNQENINANTISDALNECVNDTQIAMNACDQDQDEGVQGAQTTLSNFALQVGNMGIGGACSGMEKYLAGANAAVLYFSQNCSQSQSKCLKSCERAQFNVGLLGLEEYPRIEQSYQSCRGLDRKLNQTKQAIQNLTHTIQTAAACAKQTEVAMYDFCKSNPTALGCKNMVTDCSNPQIAATNPICICKMNPSSPSCVGVQAKAGDLNSGFKDVSGTSISNSLSGGDAGLESDPMFSSLDYAGNGMTPSKGAAEDVGGKKGGRPLLDGGGGSFSGGDSKGSGSAAANSTSVNAGFRSGGGWGASGNSRSYGNENQGAGYSNSNSKNDGPNLRDFLPNGKFDPRAGNRGLAGISGPDGITGPHSNIWKKVQHRYKIQVENSKLMP